MNNTNTIAEKIKHYRKIKEMSQDDLAKLSGINVSTIKKYECGIRNPKPEQLSKIANALNVSINAFISYDVASLNDIIYLLVKLEQQAQMKIIGNKDENGNYDPNSIRLSFNDAQVNNALVSYLQAKDNNNIQIDYEVQLDQVLMNIESM